MLNQAIKSLKANKLKTLLIYLSLTFSIIAIFLITAISSGIISMYSNMLKSDGDIIITQAKISDTFFSNVELSLMQKIQQLPSIKEVSALIVGASPVENIPIVAVYGVSSNRFKNYTLTQGKYPKNDEILIGEGIFNQLNNKTDITLANKKFKISGVFQSEIGFENGGVVLTLHDAGAIFNKEASMLLANVHLDANIKDTIQQISALSLKIEAKSTTSFIENYNQFKILQNSSNIISVVAFMMGLLGITSLMSITVNQRKNEFGIMRALGISMKRIILSIMFEGFVVAFLSFLSAFFISHAILFIIKNSEQLQGYVNGEITPTLALIVFIASVTMTLLGSILPAISAAKTDPITLIIKEQ
ncbi:MAG: ABC transporter permease [Candidatus Marinarcus sp.]|uniref:ABC transporter permease n=1 Tax=Candidatus Marinarcus sp. TaxID=3100987 RepID=UPI003B002751